MTSFSSAKAASAAAADLSRADPETNPMCIYLVKNDSKGDKLLFRYPLCNFGSKPVKVNVNDHKRSLHKDAGVDKPAAVRPHQLTDFTDDVISSLFAVKTELCERKFELKVNDVRFVGHPILIRTGGPGIGSYAYGFDEDDDDYNGVKNVRKVVDRRAGLVRDDDNGDGNVGGDGGDSGVGGKVVGSIRGRGGRFGGDGRRGGRVVDGKRGGRIGDGSRGGRSGGVIKKKPESPSIILINIVFALDAFANRQVSNCYYDLSKMIGVALRHEEKRCSYLSDQIRDMLIVHDSMTMASGSECDLDMSLENDQHFEKILNRCTLAQDLKRVFEDVCTTGVVKFKVNGWIDVSFCLPYKVHHFFKDGQYFEPEAINKCLKELKPYHGLLMMAERKVLLDKLPQDASPSVVRLINMYSPVKSLQTLSADCDLTLAQVFNIAGHLIYWGDAIVIFPLSETNMYAIAPNIPTERNNKFAQKFEKQFPEFNLLEVMSEFSFPTSLQYKMCPVDDKSSGSTMIQILIWLLQHKILLQFHMYIYFMPSSKGLVDGYYTDDSEVIKDDNRHPSEAPMATYQTLSKNWLQSSTGGYSSSMSNAEEMFHSLDEEEQLALMHIPASANPDDFRLLMRLLKQGYLSGEHHVEEIMYLENIRRSDLLKLLDKFKDVIVVVEMEDPVISSFYSY